LSNNPSQPLKIDEVNFQPSISSNQKPRIQKLLNMDYVHLPAKVSTEVIKEEYFLASNGDLACSTCGISLKKPQRSRLIAHLNSGSCKSVREQQRRDLDGIEDMSFEYTEQMIDEADLPQFQDGNGESLMNVDNLFPSNSIMRDTLEGDPEVMAETTQEEEAEELLDLLNEFPEGFDAHIPFDSSPAENDFFPFRSKAEFQLFRLVYRKGLIWSDPQLTVIIETINAISNDQVISLSTF
jgi:hypothetical protein